MNCLRGSEGKLAQFSIYLFYNPFVAGCGGWVCFDCKTEMQSCITFVSDGKWFMEPCTKI